LEEGLNFRFLSVLVVVGLKRRPSRKLVLAVLADGKPRSSREVQKAAGLSASAANNALILCWKRGLVLRTKRPLFERERIFKGRAGVRQTTRPYHLYVLRPEGKDSVVIDAQHCRLRKVSGNRVKTAYHDSPGHFRIKTIATATL